MFARTHSIVWYNSAMNIHYFQHVDYEGLGCIEPWAYEKGHTVTRTCFFQGELPPPFAARSAAAGEAQHIDWLIIMGGPMNIYEESLYPWLVAEKRAIEAAIAQNTRVLGICLGAQLISHVLGGTITQNHHQEIGWFPVSLTPLAHHSRLHSACAQEFTALHWHGDTFSIPRGALHIARSRACAHQAFDYDNSRVVGLQFHLEATRTDIDAWRAHQTTPRPCGPFIQQDDELLQMTHTHSRDSISRMRALLDSMAERREGQV
jgi:GMP synthase (glutamine-hydrolysing)